MARRNVIQVLKWIKTSEVNGALDTLFLECDHKTDIKPCAGGYNLHQSMASLSLVWFLLISTALLVGIALYVKRYSDVSAFHPFVRQINIVSIARNALMENMDDIFIVLDVHGNIADFNHSAQTALAPSPLTIGASPTTLSQPWAGIFQRHADTSSCKEEITLELDSSICVYELTISQIQDKQAHNLGKLFLFHDITKRKQAEAEDRKQRIFIETLRDTAEARNSRLDIDNVLEKIEMENARFFSTAERQAKERKQAEEQLRKLSQAVEQSPVSIVITDTSGRIEYVNPRFVQLTGYTLDEAIGKNPRILKTDKTGAETHRQLWKTISAGKEWRGEFINHKKNGELYHESALISPIIDSNGVTTHYLAVKEDITERKLGEEKILLLQEELREQAMRDPLTDLYNRRYLNEFMKHELARAEREQYSVCFVMIDIDHFKKINDAFGHDAGDLLLQNLANQLQRQARAVDIMCRYGGEEFLVILPNVTAEIAFQITQRWRSIFMGSTLPLEYNRVKATISCGISEYPAHGSVGSELITLADKAMYQAKANGRNQVVIWQAEQDG